MRPSEPAPPELSLFALPKAFEGHIGVIQRNAIQSWTRIEPMPRILLLGDEAGTAELAEELDLIHLPEVAKNERGVPLVSSIFAAAEAESPTAWQCYINSDIILLEDFGRALFALAEALKHEEIGSFLLSAQRGHIDQFDPIDFADPVAAKDFAATVARELVWDHKLAVDLFLFSRGLFDAIPPFALGRGAWDNWLLWKAEARGAAVLDASACFGLVHQVHDYAHTGAGWQGAWSGVDSQGNIQLANGHLRSLDQAATHALTWNGLHEGPAIDRCDRLELARARLRSGLRAWYEGRTEAALDFLREGLVQMHRFLPGAACWAAEAADLAAALPQNLDPETFSHKGQPEKALVDLLQAALCRRFAEALEHGAGTGRKRPLYVWGAGEAGRRAADFLLGRGLSVAGHVDSDPATTGSELQGLAVHPPAVLERAAAGGCKAFVVIASMYAAEIETQLETMGYETELDYTR